MFNVVYMRVCCSKANSIDIETRGREGEKKEFIKNLFFLQNIILRMIVLKVS